MRPCDPKDTPEGRADRRQGALLGLAVGDALGATYEFCSPREIPEDPLRVVGGGWLDLAPGETTDDTALASCVLDGYRQPPFDVRRTRESMISWMLSGPKDIGNQTRQSLVFLHENPSSPTPPADQSAQGNGSVMRAPAHVVAPDASTAAANARKEAALTHPSYPALAASSLVAACTRLLVDRPDPHHCLRSAYHIAENQAANDTPTDAGQSDAQLDSPQAVFQPLDTYRHDPGGWVVYTTRLALLCVLEATDFRVALERVVRLGGDADTNAAVAGALLGARFGSSSIPREWSERILPTNPTHTP